MRLSRDVARILTALFAALLGTFQMEESLSAQDRTDAGYIVGQVVSEGFGRPLVAARVELRRQGAFAVTDSAGRFVLSGLEPGEDTLYVSTTDFSSAPTAVHITGGVSRLTIEVPYASVALEELTVRVSRPDAERLEDFERRRALRLGEYVTEAEIAARQPDELTRMVRELPGVRVGQGSVFVRGRDRRGRTVYCTPAFYVNGVPRRPGLNKLDDLSPDDVIGIEIYRHPLIPGQFYDRRYPCGAVVVWTA